MCRFLVQSYIFMNAAKKMELNVDLLYLLKIITIIKLSKFYCEYFINYRILYTFYALSQLKTFYKY